MERFAALTLYAIMMAATYNGLLYIFTEVPALAVASIVISGSIIVYSFVFAVIPELLARHRNRRK